MSNTTTAQARSGRFYAVCAAHGIVSRGYVADHAARLMADEHAATHPRYSITVYTTTYGEWEEGADERPVLDTDSEVIEFDHLTEVAEYLSTEGVDSPSESAPYRLHTWLSLAAGTAPTAFGNYTGEDYAKSAHVGHGFTAREWVAVVNHLANA